MASLGLGIGSESTIWPVDDPNLMGDAAVRAPNRDAIAMSLILQPWQLLVCIIAGWIHQRR
jgi:hypothetical protein